jgi:uncharacterized membrane protein YvbJ
MYCEKCGVPVQDGAVFCAKCGASLNGGLNAQEQAELQRLKLQNERARRTWYVILGVTLVFLGGLIVGGLEVGVIAAAVVGVILAVASDNKTKKQMQKPKEETKA